jgi:hypothetical protein
MEPFQSRFAAADVARHSIAQDNIGLASDKFPKRRYSSATSPPIILPTSLPSVRRLSPPAGIANGRELVRVVATCEVPPRPRHGEFRN